jgi:hypothetical protein
VIENYEAVPFTQRGKKDQKAQTTKLDKISKKVVMDSMYLSKMQSLLAVFWG